MRWEDGAREVKRVAAYAAKLAHHGLELRVCDDAREVEAQLVGKVDQPGRDCDVVRHIVVIKELGGRVGAVGLGRGEVHEHRRPLRGGVKAVVRVGRAARVVACAVKAEEVTACAVAVAMAAARW